MEKIRFAGAEAYKETYKNGILTAIRTPINDYTSFLKEISYLQLQEIFPSNILEISENNQEYEHLISRSFKFLTYLI